MPNRSRGHADDLRAASKLAVAATQEVTAVVGDIHRAIASGPAILGKPFALPARLLTGLVYGNIRNVTGLVGRGVDAALAVAAPVLGESAPGPEREAVVAALNGVLGDYLKETANPLAIPMALRRGGVALPLEREALAAAVPNATGKLLVAIHGSSMSDLAWCRLGHDHAAALESALGYTAVYVHYNSGLHVSTNGRELAVLLEALVLAWPVEVREMALLGHSMGGLVARSACHEAERAHLSWRSKLTKYVSLGTPHHGSPLERGGSLIHELLQLVAYSAPLGRLAQIRSAGVTDLRYGNVLDEHWEGQDRFAFGVDTRSPLPLPVGVACYAIAASTGTTLSARLPGDGLVPAASALGKHRTAALTLAFPEEHTWVALGARHLDLLSRADVYERLAAWLSEPK